MAQQYSTPGNSQSNFYTPQATSTRQSQSTPSYFGTGGQTGYSQAAYAGGNNGNPSGIGSGAAGINAGDGPGAGSAGLNYGNGPNGFISSLEGTANVPGSTGNFQWGSVTSGPWGTNYSDPATAQQYSDNMMATGDPYGSMYGGQPAGTGPNSIMPGASGGTPGYDPSGGMFGGGTAGGQVSQQYGASSGYFTGNGSYIPGNYAAAGYVPTAAQSSGGGGGSQAAFNQAYEDYMRASEERQAQQHQAFLDANPSWIPPDQLAANRQTNAEMRAAEDALLAQYPGGIPNDVHQQMLSQFGMQAGGNTGQSQLGAAMQSGMPTQAIGQQMGAPGAVDPYSTALPESFAQGGYQPGDTSIPTGSIGGSPPNAVSPERFGRLPVSELQRIASGQGSQLRPELQQQAAMMASNELARRGAAGNNLAAGNQQAQDPRAVEQSGGFQRAEQIRQLQNMGIDTRGVTPLDAMRGNVPATQEQMAEQQRLQQAGMSRQNQRMGLDLPELEERLRGNNVPEDNTQPQQQPQSGYGQFAQGFQQGLGWMDPTRLFGGGNDLVRNGQGGLTMAPGGFPQSANDPFQPALSDAVDIGQMLQEQFGSTGAYGLPDAIAGGGYNQNGMLQLPPGMGGQSGWNTTGAPDVPGVGVDTLGPGNIPGTIGGDVPTRPMAPQGPGGVQQNPYEKMPGYVQPYEPQQQTPSTGTPIWGSQPQPSSNPYPGTIQTIPFGQGLPPGISGSMAVGPVGKPYGGTPNLSPSGIPLEPGYGNDVVQRPGYGDDVEQRPGTSQQQPAGNAAQQPSIDEQLRNARTMQERSTMITDAIRNAQSPQEEQYLINLLNADTQYSQTGSHPLQNYLPITQLGYHPALLSAIMGNPSYN